MMNYKIIEHIKMNNFLVYHMVEKCLKFQKIRPLHGLSPYKRFILEFFQRYKLLSAAKNAPTFIDIS